MGARRRSAGGGVGGSIVAARIPVAYSYTSADLTADGSEYKIAVPHALGTRAYIWQVYDTNSGNVLLVEHTHQGATYLTIWFSHPIAAFTVNII